MIRHRGGMKKLLFLLLLAAVTAPALAGSNSSNSYVAHEWGTFTSVQGADGIQLEWNPLAVADLPDFVYGTTKPGGDPRRRLTAFSGKSSFRTLQRMETPVIYFYSDRERTADVTVKFPQGLITEWFPQARDIGPSAMLPRPALVALDEVVGKTGLKPSFTFTSLDTKKGIADSLIRWTGVKIIPEDKPAKLGSALPADKSGSHYYAARETDAALLRVNAPTSGGQQPENEKFLFYRGVGNFQAPLQLMTGSSEDYVQIRNTGAEDLVGLFVLQIRPGQGKFTFLDRLAAGTNSTVNLEPVKDFLPLGDLTGQISRQMQKVLVSEGLYEREARAMVNTWRDSWFEEQGLRVLYILPRRWTDRILPISVEPKPNELVRVMVGRAELITPTMEWKLLKQIVRFSENNPDLKARIVEDTRRLGSGRFLEPTVRRVLGPSPNLEFSQSAWKILELVSKPAGSPAALARN